MRKIWIPLLSAVVVIAFAAFQKSEPKSQIKVQVEAVNVLVTVMDRDGRYVTNLDRNRFQIFEDKKLQTIQNFEHQTDLPLRLGLMIDTSASVRLKLDFEKQAATNFVRAVMRPEDQALLVEFDTGVQLVNDFTDRPGVIADKLRRLRAGGGTSLLDALYVVAQEMMASGTDRRAIVVLSDGEDRNSKRDLDETTEMLQRSGVVVYAIGTSKFGASSNPQGEDTLKKLAEATGGRVFFPYSADLLDQAFEQINTELRSQYSLTYVPQNKERDGRYRRIQVKIVDSKGLKARYRDGYYAPKG